MVDIRILAIENNAFILFYLQIMLIGILWIGEEVRLRVEVHGLILYETR